MAKYVVRIENTFCYARKIWAGNQGYAMRVTNTAVDATMFGSAMTAHHFRTQVGLHAANSMILELGFPKMTVVPESTFAPKRKWWKLRR